MKILTAAPGLTGLSSQIFTTTNNLRRFNFNFRRFSSSSSSIRDSSYSSVPAAGVNNKAVEKPPTADESPDHQTPPPPDSFTSREISDNWETARHYLSRGVTYRAQANGFNSGGLLVPFQYLRGFLPFSELSPSHYCKEPDKTNQEIAKTLCGSPLPVKVIQADEENKKLIFSEKAFWSEYSQVICVGDIFKARVSFVADFGALLHLHFPDGCYHLTGLVHASEVSWDYVHDARDILNKGDEVRARVIKIDRSSSFHRANDEVRAGVIKIDSEKLRILLSLKQLEEDPLLETLDKVIPQNGLFGSDSSSTDDIEPIPGLETIIQELLREDGINGVTITREGFEKWVVSHDLQLWLSNAPSIGDHFTLLARAGRLVQEIQLTTTLDREGIKAALHRVLERVP